MSTLNPFDLTSSRGVPLLVNNEKPGSIVDKVRDELNKTVKAKRLLLERNFMHFRFDEFKKQNQNPVQQLEEPKEQRRKKVP